MKTTYKIDPAHSTAHFSVRHMLVTNVRGAFSKVEGTAVIDTDNPAASSVDATTIFKRPAGVTSGGAYE